MGGPPSKVDPTGSTLEIAERSRIRFGLIIVEGTRMGTPVRKAAFSLTGSAVLRDGPYALKGNTA